MKANAIITVFVAVLLFSGSSFAQGNQDPASYNDPHFGMTMPADFVMPTDPSIGAYIESPNDYGIYIRVPRKVKIRSNEPLPAEGPLVDVDDTPNYENNQFYTYTDPAGNTFSVKVVTSDASDSYPVFSGDRTNEDDRAAYEAAIEKWYSENPGQ